MLFVLMTLGAFAFGLLFTCSLWGAAREIDVFSKASGRGLSIRATWILWLILFGVVLFFAHELGQRRAGHQRLQIT